MQIECGNRRQNVGNIRHRFVLCIIEEAAAHTGDDDDDYDDNNDAGTSGPC